MSVSASTVKRRSLDPPSRSSAVPGTQVRLTTFRERGRLAAAMPIAEYQLLLEMLATWTIMLRATSYGAAERGARW